MTSNQVEKSTFAKALDFIQPFWIGGISGMLATCVIQPVDMIKTVIQLKSEQQGILRETKHKANFLVAATDIYKT
jgi:hypothetical protein